MPAAINQILHRRLKDLEVKARRRSREILHGRTLSVFKGRGMDFAEVREYAPGDDVRRIDWNITARLRRPYVKQHHEEHSLTILVAVDQSASLHFGTSTSDTQAATKQELAAILAGSLIQSAIDSGDRAGLLLFSNGIETAVPPAKGQDQLTRCLVKLLEHEPKHQQAHLEQTFRDILRIWTRPTVLFVISDFLNSPGDRWEIALRTLNQRHEVLALLPSDPRETELPDVGVVAIEDAETGEFFEIDSANAQVRDEYRRLGQARWAATEQQLRNAGVPNLRIGTNADWGHKVQQFLQHQSLRRLA